MFTGQREVVDEAMRYHWWCAIVPAVSMVAFVWDGVFIGVTATRGMLTSVATACVLFFILYFTLPTSLGNHALWIAFVTFLTTRSAVQTAIWLLHWNKKA